MKELSEVESELHGDVGATDAERIKELEKKMADNKIELTKNQRKNYRKKLKKLRDRLQANENNNEEQK
jgi:phosphoenolpyruvate carboxylase